MRHGSGRAPTQHRALAAGAALALGITFPAAGQAAGERAGVTAALEASARAWSDDDLGGFMRAYEDGPSTTYLKGSAVVRGFEAIRAMYAQRLGHGSAGRLSLEVLEVRPLGPGYALCIGRYALAPAAPGPVAGGLFTLVFRHARDGWKIVSDHTS